MVARNNPNEIHLIRVYDFPVQVVWDAWTDLEQVAQWWGPRGFTITTHSKELRPGGIWHYTMHGPDGVDYQNKTVYYEVNECSKLVYDHGGYDDRPPLFRVTVLFSESKGKTTMEMTFACPTAEQAATMRKLIKEVGGNATWDRLAEHMDETQRSRSSFVINRSLDASIEEVFEHWTNPALLCKWLPPTGFDMEFVREDLRPGGVCFFRMKNTQGDSLYAQWEYLEIESPRRIVYIQRFCDEKETIGRHPGLPVFPAAILMSITFATECETGTRITMSSEPRGEASPAETLAFINLRSSMAQGWSNSIDALESILANPPLKS